ncbi:MAG: hypothetical protein IPM27_04035 [Nitrosomonadales bacterium]|nr:hypothetical protein [Nitrosomonadales bacterium]
MKQLTLAITLLHGIRVGDHVRLEIRQGDKKQWMIERIGREQEGNALQQR